MKNKFNVFFSRKSKKPCGKNKYLFSKLKLRREILKIQLHLRRKDQVLEKNLQKFHNLNKLIKSYFSESK